MKKIVITFLFVLALIYSKAQYVDLYTPFGSTIETISFAEGEIEWINANTNWHKSVYGAENVLAPASRKYNCHSYAWNIKEGGTRIVWLNKTDYQGLANLSKYWTDGSYIETTEANAEKINYYIGDHSAIPSPTISGKYESKWGDGPVMRHDPVSVPYSSPGSRKYYRKANLYINGPSNQCYNESGTFSINDLPSYATVSWYANNLTPNSATGKTFSASPVFGQGVGYVRATVTIGSKVFTFQNSLALNGYIPIDGPEITYLSEKKANYTMDEGRTVVEWRINGTVVTPLISNTLTVNLNNYYPGSNLITCKVVTSCGTYTAEKYFEVIDDMGGYEYTIYPNPTTDFVTVSMSPINEIEEYSLPISTTSKIVEPYNIQFWNDESGLVKTIEANVSKVQISLKDLNKGMYFVHIVKDKKVLKKQILWIK